MVYIENVDFLKKHFKISGKKFDFTRLSLLKKHLYLSYYSTFQHKNINLTFKGLMIYILSILDPILSS